MEQEMERLKFYFNAMWNPEIYYT